MKSWKILLILIVILASFLRVWNLSYVPPSLDWDEVAYGYNAYSILQTGKDEYGVKFPVILRSFDDYKPALYAYLTVPSVAVFGLNSFATRLPNAIFGVIGVFATFFLVRKIFQREDIALLSAFFLAVSPWSIQFSRFSHEAVVGVAFNILTVLFFIKGIKKPKFLIFSGIFWGLSFYSYQSEKLFAPLLGLLLFAVFFKDLWKIPKKNFVVPVIVTFLIILPMLFYVVGDSRALNRAKGTSIFSHQTEILDQSAKRLIEDKRNNNVLGLIINNRRVVYSGIFVKNYLSHYDPVWLFFKGDLPRHHPPNMGILYLWELPFILAGVISLLRGKYLNKKYKLLIFGWFLIAPIPAALTFDVPHAARSMNVLPIFQIFTAVGAVSVFQYLKTKLKSSTLKILMIFIISLFIVNFTYYVNQYFVKLNVKYSSEWQYGYKEAIFEIEKIKGNYNQIIVSDKSPLDQSYMFFLFNLKYSPQEYQNSGSRKSFDKYVFRQVNWEKDSNLPNALIVGSVKEIPGNAHILKTIYYLNNEPAIIIATSQK